MPTVVIPFAGVEGKTRLLAPLHVRRELSLAMLGDVLEACSEVGPTRVVTSDQAGAELARAAGATTIGDPGGGQGAAVQAALDGLAGLVLLVNADLPCVTVEDLRELVRATPRRGVALVGARDGTTNVLSLPGPEAFAPLYGPGSAERFASHARALGLEVLPVAAPNLVDDVDTFDDLRRLESRCGPRTRHRLAGLRVVAAS